jgi:hypothetical protein
MGLAFCCARLVRRFPASLFGWDSFKLIVNEAPRQAKKTTRYWLAYRVLFGGPVGEVSVYTNVEERDATIQARKNYEARQASLDPPSLFTHGLSVRLRCLCVVSQIETPQRAAGEEEEEEEQVAWGAWAG